MQEDTEMFELPEIIELTEFGGNFHRYLEAVYEIFKADFVDSKPVFRGVKLGLKRHPEIEGRAYTFYHMTHSGDIENSREPDLRRMERMAWPKPMIDDSEHPYLKVWRNIRRGPGGTRNRILIMHTEEKYLVVLDDRTEYILPWTAYYLRSTSEVEKKLKEFEAYKKAESAGNS